MLSEKIEKIISYQVEHKLSNDDLCREIGITRMTLNNLMRQKTEPQLKTIELLDNFIQQKEAV